jgi:hypothetical protein
MANKGNSDLSQNIDCADGEKELNASWILEVELTGFADALDVEGEEKDVIIDKLQVLGLSY